MRLALTATACLALAVACSNNEELAITPTPAPEAAPEVTPITGEMPTPGSTSTFGPNELAAIAIVEADPLMNDLFPNREVAGVSPWYIDDVHRATFVNINLDPPVDIDADLPYAYIGAFANEGSTRLTTPLPDPGYEVRSTHITMSAVRALAVAVDVSAGRVIEILALPFPNPTS